MTDNNSTDDIRAEVKQALALEHSQKVREGMARVKREGRRLGRPRKVLTEAELAQARALHADGVGWRRIALALSRGRGAFDVADPARRRELTVSYMHVRRALLVVASPLVTKSQPLQNPSSCSGITDVTK